MSRTRGLGQRGPDDTDGARAGRARIVGAPAPAVAKPASDAVQPPRAQAVPTHGSSSPHGHRNGALFRSRSQLSAAGALILAGMAVVRTQRAATSPAVAEAATAEAVSQAPAVSATPGERSARIPRGPFRA